MTKTAAALHFRHLHWTGEPWNGLDGLQRPRPSPGRLQHAPKPHICMHRLTLSTHAVRPSPRNADRSIQNTDNIQSCSHHSVAIVVSYFALVQRKGALRPAEGACLRPAICDPECTQMWIVEPESRAAAAAPISAVPARVTGANRPWKKSAACPSR